MTWNIHGSIGLNPRFDMEKVAALILRADPDIVALQEVDSRRAANGDPFLMLEKMLGHYGIGAKSIVTGDGDYGQMLMSRWPFFNTQIHDISYGEFEPRRAICTQIETPDGKLHVVATHLGLSIRERRRQARALLTMIGEATPFVLMGDFNDWFWPGSIRRMLARILPGHSSYRTFPSFAPLLRLDRIYCRPRGILLQSWTDRQARHLSDHLPVIADIVLNPSLDVDGASLSEETVSVSPEN